MGMTFGDEENSSYFTFFSPLRQYNITKFQRTYTWGEYQIQGIIRDVRYVLETGESVAWPSILIQRSPERRDDNPNVTYYDVGDGQQRIISVSLGLLALSRIASERRYVEENVDEDLEYLHNFIPDINDPRKREGILGRVEINGKTRSFQPVVNFFSESSNTAFKSIFVSDDEELEKKIDSSITNEDDFSKLYTAFKIYYNEYRLESYSNSDLRAVADTILKKIQLTVIEYESSENMQRAFANMNSFGIQLTEPELVKAEFYGHFKQFDPELAEEMAEYWTSELESVSWHGELFKQSSFGKTQKTSPLDTFLQEYYHTVTNWRAILKTPQTVNGSATISITHQPHWLRDGWAEVLHNHEDLRQLWSDFKKAAAIIKTSRSRGVFVKNSADWWANYSYHTLNQLRYYASILIKLRLQMKDDEFIKSVNLLMKYWLYLNFVTNNSLNMHHSLIHSSSRLINLKEWTYDELAFTLQSATAPKLQWRDERYIQDKLTYAEYDDAMNTKVVELLIYICNQKHLQSGHIDGLYNTRTTVVGAKRSREHILPQTPREDLSEEARSDYDTYVKRLGNSIILSTYENSSASNKSIQDKIKDYRNSHYSPWGTLWNGMFLQAYTSSGKWEFDDISTHSKKMASVIAPYLSPKTPYSEFKGLLIDNVADDIFSFRDESGDADFILTEEGLLSFDSGLQFGSLADLKEIMPTTFGEKRVLHLIKFGSSPDKIEKSISIRNGVITNNVTLGSASRTNIRVICEDFDVSSNSMRSIYNSFFDHFWLTHETCLRAAFSGINRGIIETSKITENRNHLYRSISSQESLYNYNPRYSMRNMFKLMADEMGFNLEIIES